MLDWNCTNSNCDLYSAAKNHLNSAVHNMMTIVNQYEFDGVAMDWETTLPTGTDPVIKNLMSALRSALGPHRQLAATAFPCCAGRVWQDSEPYVDRLLLMDYDMGGGNSNFAWFNSALYNPTEFPKGGRFNGNDGFSVDGSVSHYEAWGYPAAKLCIGIPFYGNTHDSATTPRRPGGNARQTHYYTLYKAYNHLQDLQFDAEADANWQPISGGYIDVDNVHTITDKVNYVKANGLGGMMEFVLGADYVQSLSPSHPLLAAIQTAMRRNSSSTKTKLLQH